MLRWPFARKRGAVAERIDPQSAYSLWARDYPPRPHNRLMELEHETVLALLPDVSGQMVLDAGCGSGRYLRELESRGARAIGMDLSAPMLHRARESTSRITRADIRALPFDAMSLDLVVCGLALGDVAELELALHEVARALRPGGRVIYSVVHPAGEAAGWSRTFEIDGRQLAIESHWHSLARHRDAAAAAGLTIEEWREPALAERPGQRAVLVVRATVTLMFWSHPVTFVNAQVLTPGNRLARTLRVRRGRIDGIDVAPDKRDEVIDLGGSFVFPGLINAHDHLELNSQPRLKWRDRYVNASEWIADFQPRFATDPALAVTKPETLDDRVWVGGLKNLLAGVTTVGHHNPIYRALRKRFPVRIVEQCGFSHSLHIDGDAVAASHRRTPADWPWMIHAAEGVDAAARAELDTFMRLGCLAPNTVFIHGVGFGDAAADRVIAAGAGLVWCPSSNQFLFEATADVRAFDDADRLALGSDSRLSGERDLLDELKAAHATRQLSAEGVARTVTTGAAQLLRLCHGGRFTVGAPADVTVIQATETCPFDTLVAASRADVRLTMIDGEPRIAEPSLAKVFSATRTEAARASLDGSPRLVARWIAKHVGRMQLSEPGFEVLN